MFRQNLTETSETRASPQLVLKFHFGAILTCGQSFVFFLTSPITYYDFCFIFILSWKEKERKTSILAQLFMPGTELAF